MTFRVFPRSMWVWAVDFPKFGTVFTPITQDKKCKDDISEVKHLNTSTLSRSMRVAGTHAQPCTIDNINNPVYTTVKITTNEERPAAGESNSP